MILYASTQFTDNDAPTLLAGSAITGQDGFAASCQVDEDSTYTESGGLTIITAGVRVGSDIQGQSAADPFGPYHQVTSVMGNFTATDNSKFLLAFCNTADIDVPTWVTTTGLLDSEEKDWGGNPPQAASVGLHTPNLTDDVYTLIVPTTSGIRQATNTRNGNSIVFHIPQNSLAVYAINANLNTAGTITSGMTDSQASEQILEYGYGLILKAAGVTSLFNIA